MNQNERKKCANDNCKNMTDLPDMCCCSGECHSGHLRQVRQRMAEEYRKRTGDPGV